MMQRQTLILTRQISLVQMPLVRHRQQMTVRWVQLSPIIIATDRCSVKNEEEANFEVSPLSDSTGPHWGGKSHREHKELARNIRPRVLIVIGVSWRRPPSVNLVDSHSKLTARCILCLLLQAGIYRGRWVYFWLQYQAKFTAPALIPYLSQAT